MTYKDLAYLILATFNEHQLECHLTIWTSKDGEYFPAELAFSDEETNVLDIGHPVLKEII
jgi:hypothetical protein